ncbi:hypothetical protein ZC03_029 [Pseudomonas phage ZC03]|uniref:Uncharacterized protein n=1 Tax=Pseudomonas phage ZC03 TaxID=1622115 RepID=A0A1L2C963_9CAUD|nr:hypothetical protein HWA93_gp29 [Pseudomonas phage ZC03]AMD43416.1 hypothetical protein ZC03_029 [Pseudomonas phage ZC03]
MTNPFNQIRFRGEHELGRAYMDIKKALENLSDIKLVADNIKNLRSGNIELRSEGSVLQWKYVNGTEWNDLVDLQILVEEYDEKFVQINQTLQNLNTQLNNFNGIVSGHSSTLSDLDQALQNLNTQLSDLSGIISTHEDTISLLESSVADLTSRVEALENNNGGGA